jgi:hypothetical protein
MWTSFGISLVDRAVAAVAILGYLWTVGELRRGHRAAWWAAVVTLATPIATAVQGRPVGLRGLLVSGIGILVLWSVRRELR